MRHKIKFYLTFNSSLGNGKPPTTFSCIDPSYNSRLSFPACSDSILLNSSKIKQKSIGLPSFSSVNRKRMKSAKWIPLRENEKIVFLSNWSRSWVFRADAFWFESIKEDFRDKTLKFEKIG